MNLHSLWPDYFGLTNDSTYLAVRERHYPLLKHLSLSDTQSVVLTKTSSHWLNFNLRSLLSFFSYESSSFLQPLAFKDLSILNQWREHLNRDRGWDICTLSRLTSEQATYLKTKQGSFCSPPRVQKIYALNLSLEATPKFSDYISSRGFRFRKNYRHSLNALIRDDFHFTELNSLDELFKLYKKRHLVKDTDDYSVDPTFQKYLSDLWTELSRERRLRTAAIYHGDKIIAAVMAFQSENDIHVFQIAYDPDFKKYNPGRNVLLKLIENNWHSGLRFMDFMSEWEYISHLTDDYFEYRQVQLYAKTFVGRLLALNNAIKSRRG